MKGNKKIIIEFIEPKNIFSLNLTKFNIMTDVSSIDIQKYI